MAGSLVWFRRDLRLDDNAAYARLGEKCFAAKLNDFDFAANNGNWQWAASTDWDAQPYFRIFNPVAQSEKFDADVRRGS
jgi:deoxyribodipyrimidine photolyase